MGSYLLPEGVGVDGVASALAPRLDVRGGATSTASWTFYDTFDGRLHRAGVTLRHDAGRLVLVERTSDAERAAAELATPPKHLFARDLPAGPLRDALAPIVEMRALTPVARVRARTRALAVLNADEKTVVRLTAETANGLRARIHATAVRGYDRELERVREVLEGELALPATAGPIVDDAIRATGAPPAGTSSKLDLRLSAIQPAGVAAEIVLARTFAIVQANFPGTLADVDSEFLHDLRVAVRRTRSLLRQLKAVFPSEPLQALRAELRRLQQITGETRDLDVQLLELDGDGALAPLHAVLVERRARAFGAMSRALRAKQTSQALQDWAALKALPQTDPIGELAGARIAKVYRSMVRDGSQIGDDTEAEALHELRKTGKELRYLLEFFGGLFEPELVKPMIKALKSLQDVLGRFQDREVQAATLRALVDDVGARDGGGEALLAMGALVASLGEDQARARAEFAAEFAAFAAPERRAAVKEAFA